MAAARQRAAATAAAQAAVELAAAAAAAADSRAARAGRSGSSPEPPGGPLRSVEAILRARARCRSPPAVVYRRRGASESAPSVATPFAAVEIAPPDLQDGPSEGEGDEAGGGAMSGLCAVCRAPATQCCSGCRRVFYCGREHQRGHWRTHKSQCLPYRVAVSERLGRYLAAARDIRAGEILLQEAALVLGPKVLSAAVCLGCLRRLAGREGEGWHRCEGCGWPLCAPDCDQLQQHTAECRLMRERGYRSELTPQAGRKESAYCSIVPLRCLLLKERDPAKYQTLLGLQSHLDERRHTPLYTAYRRNVAGFIREAMGLLQLEEDTVLEMAAILDTNSFEVRRGPSRGRAVYPTAALLAHDCVPNTKHIFKGPEFTMKVISTVPIKKGDVISTTYTQALWSTLARREHLRIAKCFDCACARCSDPTELGTYLGAITCTRCCRGGGGGQGGAGAVPEVEPACVVSTDPLDPAACWRCERCGRELPARQLVWGNAALRQELDALDPRRPDVLERFLDKYADALHPRNTHVVQAKYALVQLYGNAEGFGMSDLSDAVLQRKLELCRELLELAETLAPGLSRLRGLLLYDLQAAMVVQAKRDYEADRITKQSAQETMNEAVQMLQQASEILRQEPDMADELQKRMDILVKELDLE